MIFRRIKIKTFTFFNSIFIIINTYTTGYSATVIKQVLKANLEKTAYKYEIVSDEIGIEIQDSGYDLPCGFTTRGIFK